MGTTIATLEKSTPVLDEGTEDFVASYRATLGQLVGYFRCKGVPRDESADMANETMVRVLVHLKRHGRDRTDLGPLVRTIARNLLIERVRKAPVMVVPLGEDVDVADDALEPADHVLASERREAVREAIRSLSPRHRRVVGMWMDGRTPTEIARALGVKRNAVDAILHRARRSLAARLDGGGVLGLVAIAGLRLRFVVRRAVETLTRLDPTGQAAPSGIAVAAVGLAAVLTFAGSAQPATAGNSGTRAAASTVTPNVTNTVDADESKIAEHARMARDEDRAAVAPHVRRTYEMRIGPGLASGTSKSDETRLADVTYDPDKNRQSAVDLDPVLEVAFEACAFTRACAAEER